jgi:hypothetical protein
MEAARTRFFGPVAWALALAIFAGFARTFYLRTWFDVPALPALFYVHGFLFSAWTVLFLVQVRLVADRNVALHRRLGVAGALLAVAMVIVGLQVTVYSAAIPRPHVMGLSSAQFSLVPLVEVAGFAAFVAAAIVLRRKPAWHKRLMVLALLTMIAPAVARLIMLSGNGQHYLLLQSLVTAAFVAWGLVHDWVRHRMVHPAFAGLGVALVLSWPLRMWFAHSAAWAPVGSWIAGLGS